MGGVGTWVEELWIWLVAVFSTTVEKVGVVLTILALIEKIPRVRHFLSEKPILDRFVPLIWVAAIACLLYGFFVVWRDEYRLTLNRDAEISVKDAELAKLRKPIIGGDIGNVTFGSIDASSETVIIEAKITNTGAPTAIDNLAAAITLRSGKVIPVIPLDVPRDGLRSGSKFFQTTDYLPRAGARPIPAGGILPGFVFGLLRGASIKDLQDFPVTVALRFNDIYGNEIIIEKALTKIEEHIDPSTLRGVVVPNS
jgi:hypothetical protein